MIYRDPLFQVLGAAEFLKTLKVPTAAPTTPAAGQVWQAAGDLSFNDGTDTKFAVNNATSFGGDVSGTYDALTVNKIKGMTLTLAGAASGQVLTFNGTAWVPTTPSATPLGAAGGDLSGTYPNPGVAKIQGQAVSATVPSSTQILKFNGSAWAPAAAPVSSDFSHNSLSGIDGGTYHLSADEYGAVNGAAAPSASNVFATMSDVTTIVAGVNWKDNVQTAAALVALTIHVDKDVRMVEDTGIGYRFDAQSTATPGATVKLPSDITVGNPGRWLDFINPNQNHNSLGGLQGGAPGDYYHLTSTEVGYVPSADQKAALAGTGTPSASNVFVTSDDTRLTDARTPVGHNQAWSTITSTPTTVAGYGITDAVLTSDARLTDARTPVGHNQAWSTITSTPTTIAGYGISDAVLSSDARLTDSRNPNGSASGDLSGNYPAPTVAKIQGVAVAVPSAAHQTAVYNGTSIAWVVAPYFAAAFVSGDWVNQGDGTSTLTLAHGLTLESPILPQVTVYENVGGAMKLCGGIDVEVGPTNVIMTIDSGAAFGGNIQLLYPLR